MMAMMLFLYGIDAERFGQLRWSYVRALLQQAGPVQYMRDLPTLELHFSQMSREQINALANPKPNGGDAMAKLAWANFTSRYKLGAAAAGVSRKAAREFLEASRAGTLPGWVVACAPVADIRQAAQ